MKNKEAFTKEPNRIISDNMEQWTQGMIKHLFKK